MTHQLLGAHMQGKPLPVFGESYAERLATALALAWIDVRGLVYERDYTVISVEREVEIPIAPDVVLMSRIDCVVRRKADGAVFAGPEWKTTGVLGDRWVESWRYSAQTIAHTLDVEYALGAESAGVLMEFIYKGRKNNKGEHVCALVAPAGEDQAQYTAHLPMSIKQEYFRSSEVWRGPRELEMFCRNVETVAEHVEEAKVSGLMAESFRPRLDQFCASDKYGHPCEFLGVCFGEIDDPLGSGMYVKRVPHHLLEFEV